LLNAINCNNCNNIDGEARFVTNKKKKVIMYTNAIIKRLWKVSDRVKPEILAEKHAPLPHISPQVELRQKHMNTNYYAEYP